MASVTTQEEREFEIAQVTRLRERYLTTDVMAKVRDDPGYAEKVELIEHALAGTEDWVLDVGANTCGESEYLTARGYKMIANDVNESRLRFRATVAPTSAGPRQGICPVTRSRCRSSRPPSGSLSSTRACITCPIPRGRWRKRRVR